MVSKVYDDDSSYDQDLPVTCITHSDRRFPGTRSRATVKVNAHREWELGRTSSRTPRGCGVGTPPWRTTAARSPPAWPRRRRRARAAATMGKPEAENKNVEIYLRVKPSPKPSRNVSFDLVKPATGTNVPSHFLSFSFRRMALVQVAFCLTCVVRFEGATRRRRTRRLNAVGSSAVCEPAPIPRTTTSATSTSHATSSRDT